MKKLLAAAMAVLSVTASLADTPTVTAVTAKQRYPWNGLVDITCTVSGINEESEQTWFDLAAVMPDSGETCQASRFWVVRDGVNSTDRVVRTNGNYRLLWDARTDLGQVVYSNMLVDVTLAVHKKVQLWAGGPYWAETNIGAEEPWDSGYYFWWGDTIGYVRENNAWVASDGSTNNFLFVEGNASSCNMGSSTLYENEWITSSDGGVLAPGRDAARVQWGGKWRMPTQQEMAAFKDKCSLTWTVTNNVIGCLVRGKGDGYSSASLFFPITDYGTGNGLAGNGSIGYYWTSEPATSSKNGKTICFLSYNGGGYCNSDNFKRYYGMPIRPVQSADQ